jgi:2-hydroxy-3-keto-5-methylthiopentenyl-1-phosphate phosphatase
VVWWSISIKLWWFGGVFQLNFGGMMEYFHNFKGNTPTYQQSLMEILQHIQKRLMEILQHTNKV